MARPKSFLSLDFFGILPVFLVYLFKPQQTNVVVIRRFSPDLSVCTFPRSPQIVATSFFLRVKQLVRMPLRSLFPFPLFVAIANC